MAFVKEIIPEEYKKEHNIEFTDEWLVDKERNAIFYYNGGNPRGSEKSFMLIFNGNVIKAGSIWRSTKDNNILEWRETYANIPQYLENQRQEILSILKDALEAFGFFFAKDTKGIVMFDPKMNFQESKGISRWH